MVFTISATHPMYHRCKVTAYLAMFQRLPMLPKKPCQVESIKKVAITLSCENNVHTASFTFFVFAYFITHICYLYFVLCEQMSNEKGRDKKTQTSTTTVTTKTNSVQLHIASSGLVVLR